MASSQINNSKKNLTIYIIYYLPGDSTKHDRTKKHIIMHLFNILKIFKYISTYSRIILFSKTKFFLKQVSLKNINYLIEVFKP